MFVTTKMTQFLSNPNPMKLLKMELHAGRAVVHTRSPANTCRGADGFVITWEDWYFRVAMVQGFVQPRATGRIEVKCKLPTTNLASLPMCVRHAFAGWIHMKFEELKPNVQIYMLNETKSKADQIMEDPVISTGGNSSLENICHRLGIDERKVTFAYGQLIFDGKLEPKFAIGDVLFVGKPGNGYAKMALEASPDFTFVTIDSVRAMSCP